MAEDTTMRVRLIFDGADIDKGGNIKQPGKKNSAQENKDKKTSAFQDFMNFSMKKINKLWSDIGGIYRDWLKPMAGILIKAFAEVASIGFAGVLAAAVGGITLALPVAGIVIAAASLAIITDSFKTNIDNLAIAYGNRAGSGQTVTQPPPSGDLGPATPITTSVKNPPDPSKISQDPFLRNVQQGSMSLELKTSVDDNFKLIQTGVKDMNSNYKDISKSGEEIIKTLPGTADLDAKAKNINANLTDTKSKTIVSKVQTDFDMLVKSASFIKFESVMKQKEAQSSGGFNFGSMISSVAGTVVNAVSMSTRIGLGGGIR